MIVSHKNTNFLDCIVIINHHYFGYRLLSNLLQDTITNIMEVNKKILGLGENQLKTNLNEDIYQAKYIHNGYARWIYKQLVQSSATLFAYTLVYLVSTRQLENLDPVNYLKTTKSKTQIYVIIALTLYSYAQDYYLKRETSEETSKDSEKAKIQETFKMFWNLSGDIARIINYFLIYCLFNQDLFSVSENSHLIIIKYALIVLWVLFTLRKVIFWLCILVFQKLDSKPWSEELKAEDKLKQIAEGASEKYNELVLLLKAYQNQIAKKQNKKQ